mmetsp:Transcript_41184/g.72330  ORF Transcript_41184/g.72330 Transcript_41184/m.72330 type:complete len:101 (+) Transcript_41184:353-655(+)
MCAPHHGTNRPSAWCKQPRPPPTITQTRANVIHNDHEHGAYIHGTTISQTMTHGTYTNHERGACSHDKRLSLGRRYIERTPTMSIVHASTTNNYHSDDDT